MRTDEETACFKALLIDYIDAGTMTTDAMAQLGISRSELTRWKQDAAFAEELRQAQEHLTECEADKLANIHELVPDAKRAQVAFNAKRWWLEKRNPKTFGEKGGPPNDQPQLLDILRAAIARHAANALGLPAAPQYPVIDLKPE